MLPNAYLIWDQDKMELNLAISAGQSKFRQIEEDEGKGGGIQCKLAALAVMATKLKKHRYYNSRMYSNASPPPLGLITMLKYLLLFSLNIPTSKITHGSKKKTCSALVLLS